MLMKIMVLMGIANIAASFVVSSVRFQSAPMRALIEINRELAKRSVSQLNQYAGFDTLGGMGLGKRSEPDQAGEKRALSTFDSLGGMGLGKRSSSSSRVFVYDKRALQHFSSLDTLGGMGFGRK
ncbi:Neuropeptide-Like Protein [Caenorhabditis elegans]|uniref:Neuropeptide-Like Protein n=1 Tax=Caenorhabditis elegans TaxID=6239 RepID=Q20017_CAEEL|nr:Neuropeptide-Like Protein [Caenorhabditis elegans]CAA90240.1 Neuropeptide-Like Protein [Caenorhabditis elegans]|eukprot:NP_495735.1 Neuropeptide-Like Protein [Caenorhabditis elegans]